MPLQSAVGIFIHSFASTLTAKTVLFKSWQLEILAQLGSGKKTDIHGSDPFKE